jgi:hypothetical protein
MPVAREILAAQEVQSDARAEKPFAFRVRAPENAEMQAHANGNEGG